MSTSNGRIAKAGKARGASKGKQEASQLSAVDARALFAFVDGAVRHGALVSFSSTRDGSAVVVTILHDELPDGKHKAYLGESGLSDEIEYWAGVFKE